MRRITVRKNAKAYFQTVEQNPSRLLTVSAIWQCTFEVKVAMLKKSK